MAIDLVLFFLGFMLLIKGASLLIDGAVSIARFWNMSPWTIGVVIVGIGTSIPEFSINIASALSGGSVGIGAVIGSNIFNILFILGIVSFLTPVVMNKVWVWKDFTVNIIAILISAGFFLFPVLGPEKSIGISHREGIVLLVSFFVWLWYMLRRTRSVPEMKTDYKAFTLTVSFVMILVGFIGVFFGGEWVVNGAEKLALFFGVNEGLVGLIIVGIGTSVPELAVSITAAVKGRSAIAVGNIIGSNIFDFLGIFGVVSLFGPLRLPSELVWPLVFALVTTLILFFVMILGKNYTLSRKEGVFFIFLYLGYIAFLFSSLTV